MTDTATVTPTDVIGGRTDRLMWIGGEQVESLTGEWREVKNPAKREAVIARVPSAGVADLDRAVKAAHDAFPAWRGRHFTERSRALKLIADELEKRTEEFSRLTAIDTGNAIRTQARPEVGVLISLFRYFAGVAGEVKGTVLPAGDNQLQYTRLEPLGVVGCILPWNSPLMIAGFKVPAALAAGNTVIMKAADDAPLTILLLAEVCNNHLPAGVVNALTRRADSAHLARTRRQEPVDRLPGCRGRWRPGRAHRWPVAEFSLRPPGPELHRWLATLPARGHLRRGARHTEREARRHEGRRPAGRGQ